MKIILVLSLVSMTVVSASPQFGFLGQLFGGGCNRGRGRQNNRPNGGGGGGGGRCGGGNQPNHQFQGQGYLISWRLGCSSFTQGGGESFCRSNGMRPISCLEEVAIVVEEDKTTDLSQITEKGTRSAWRSSTTY